MQVFFQSRDLQIPVLAGFLVFLALLLAVPSKATSTDSLEVITSSGTHAFRVELALTPSQRATGLMHRAQMDADAGMLFRFDSVRPVMMWMKNTLIPLDMLFIRPDGTVATIHRNAVPHSEKVISSGEPVRYVLELNAGIADEIGVEPGDSVVHPIINSR